MSPRQLSKTGRIALKPHIPLVLLLLVFTVLVQIYGWALTPFEGPDEPEHFAYVLKIRQEGKLPDPEVDAYSVIAQEAAQPPLFYLTAALFSELRKFDPQDADYHRNPWTGHGDAPGTSADNRNFYLMSPENHAMSPAQITHARALVWTRKIAVVYGLLAVTGLYLSGLALWPGERKWALLAAMLVAFNPQVIQAAAVVGNDIASIGFAALTLAGALYLYRDWHNPRLLALTGLVMGLGALSKVGGLTLWVVPALTILLAWEKERREARRPITIPTLRPLLWSGFVLIGVATLIGGWWYLRAWVLYDDPFGLNPHRVSSWGRGEIVPLTYFQENAEKILRWTWANLGWVGVHPGGWAYLTPLITLVLGAVGWRNVRGDRRLLPLAVMLVLGVVAIWRWSSVSSIIPGRLLLPYMHALVLIVVWGLRGLPGAAAIRMLLAGTLGGCAVIIGMATLRPAFSPPPLLDAPPDDLHGPVIDFGPGIARFVGYRVSQTRVEQGDRLHFTLCWQAPEGEEKSAVSYPFALHIVGDQNKVVGGRDSYPGMGNYTLWQPGKAFCDRFDLVLREPLDAGRVYPFSLTLFDFDTRIDLPAFSADGSPREDPWIGRLISSAPDVSKGDLLAAPVRFTPIYLLEHTLVVEDGALRLDTVWGTVAPPGETYKLFVHIIDQAGAIARQADPLLGGERYPTWAWDTGERIDDTVIIPIADLPPGDYQVMIGVYEANDWTRLPATDAAGNRFPDDAVPLDTITLE